MQGEKENLKIMLLVKKGGQFQKNTFQQCQNVYSWLNNRITINILCPQYAWDGEKRGDLQNKLFLQEDQVRIGSERVANNFNRGGEET